MTAEAAVSAYRIWQNTLDKIQLREADRDKMSWKEECTHALLEKRIFLSSMHCGKFRMLHEEFCNEPFYSKGLCKCIFIASWNSRFFLRMQNDLRLLAEKEAVNTEYMMVLGEKLMKNLPASERALCQMMYDFLKYPGKNPDESMLMCLSSPWVPIADNAIDASNVIDSLE